MKAGQIAGNNQIATCINVCFGYIDVKDQQKFSKKFHVLAPDSEEKMHTFRELILGAYLTSNGFTLRYEYPVCSKTPDWCILNDKLAVIGIVELGNFHIDRQTENEIKMRRTLIYWRDGNTNNAARLYRCIQDKADRYRALANELKIPYVVSMFGTIEAAIDFEEVKTCLFDNKIGLFKSCAELSGVLYFEERGGRYYFGFASNPWALHPVNFQSGVFPSPAP